MQSHAVRVFVHPIGGWRGSPPLAVETCDGDPVDELRKRAERTDARLVAVGSRVRGPIRRALLGSVSGALAAAAPLPVLIVSPHARINEPPEVIAESYAGH